MMLEQLRSRTLITLALALGVGTALGVVATNAWRVRAAADDVKATFVPIEPCRLMDTRSDFRVGPRGAPLGTDDTHTVVARGASGDCVLASNAVGLSLNVTAVGATLPTFLAVWGDGPRPDVSALNPAPGEPPIPNAVVTPLSADGEFRIYNKQGTVDVIVDVNGYFAHHDHDDLYVRPDDLEHHHDDLYVEQSDLDPPVGLDHALGPQAFDLTGPAESVVDVTLTAPAPGYVIVTANGYTYLGTGGLDQVRCSITNGAVAVDSNREFWTDDHGVGGGDPYVPFSSTRVFPVLSGDTATTFRLVCAQNSGDVEIRDSSITALWVPTRY